MDNEKDQNTTLGLEDPAGQEFQSKSTLGPQEYREREVK